MVRVCTVFFRPDFERFPLSGKQEIDLQGAFLGLHKDSKNIQASYDTERVNKGLWISFNGLSFWVYKSGKFSYCRVDSVEKLSECEKLMLDFWKEYLKGHVVRK